MVDRQVVSTAAPGAPGLPPDQEGADPEVLLGVATLLPGSWPRHSALDLELAEDLLDRNEDCEERGELADDWIAESETGSALDELTHQRSESLECNHRSIGLDEVPDRRPTLWRTYAHGAPFVGVARPARSLLAAAAKQVVAQDQPTESPSRVCAAQVLR